MDAPPTAAQRLVPGIHRVIVEITSGAKPGELIDLLYIPAGQNATVLESGTTPDGKRFHVTLQVQDDLPGAEAILPATQA